MRRCPLSINCPLSSPVCGHSPENVQDLIREVYLPAGMQVSQSAIAESESAEYGAARFGLDGQTIVYRVAKTTPTKQGQFVTLWKRAEPGSPITPLDSEDGIGFVVIQVAGATGSGQFVFDHNTLVSHGIISVDGKGGKRALRVYPPWVNPRVKQAVTTQQWQLRHYVSLSQTIDRERVRHLFAGRQPTL